MASQTRCAKRLPVGVITGTLTEAAALKEVRKFEPLREHGNIDRISTTAYR